MPALPTMQQSVHPGAETQLGFSKSQLYIPVYRERDEIKLPMSKKRDEYMKVSSYLPW